MQGKEDYRTWGCFKMLQRNTFCVDPTLVNEKILIGWKVHLEFGDKFPIIGGLTGGGCPNNKVIPPGISPPEKFWSATANVNGELL